jgi:hypothetical protein
MKAEKLRRQSPNAIIGSQMLIDE